jgi:hypothetical protein
MVRRTMAQSVCIQVEFDEDRNVELRREAERLGITAEEVVQRAVAAWLVDTAEERRPAEQV